MPKKSSSEIVAYPSFPAVPAQGDTELPGELTPLEAGDAMPWEAPETLAEEMPSDPIQEFVDQYTPPFQPAPTPTPLVGAEKPRRALTQPIGLQMAMFLERRARKGPGPMKGLPPEEQQVEERAGGTPLEDVKNAVMTKSMPALKQAIRFLGIASERNPNGISLDIKTARQIFFNKASLDEVEEAEFRADMENGDLSMDSKKIRTFVNYDGSITYEILNDDKSVMSRFTMGEYQGRKVFVQGGYAAYAQGLREIAALKSKSGSSEFESIRKKAGGV